MPNIISQIGFPIPTGSCSNIAYEYGRRWRRVGDSIEVDITVSVTGTNTDGVFQ
ncbi:MAG: hypothetical protein U0T83_07560 [Bacteriovoracaceae bacterium]